VLEGGLDTIGEVLLDSVHDHKLGHEQCGTEGKLQECLHAANVLTLVEFLALILDEELCNAK
jgi:hypothetical protein